MDPSDSNIFSLASVGSYLDALSSITDEMSLKERSNLIFLDKCLHEQWGLGQNVLLNWSPIEDGITLLIVPHYAVASYAKRHEVGGNGTTAVDGTLSEEFFQTLLSGQRRLEPAQLEKVARLLRVEPKYLPLRDSVLDSASQQRVIEKMVKRYSISYVASRAVALFDIVGFSLLSPFEQMTQLNSLSYSLNSAQSRLMSKRIGIDFARSTTGDGFYIWNRDLTLDANVNLYQFMQLVLADNAIARRKAAHEHTVPRLRACFHVGSSYEFHQAEGLNPTLYNYIVGDVTVDLARMIEYALPGQILVGEFDAAMPTGRKPNGEYAQFDSVDFVIRATETLAQLTGIELAGEPVDAIKCYLTGSRLENGEFSVRRIIFDDKHGISRHVYNAKANIYRRNAQPILLGIEDRLIVKRQMIVHRSEQVIRPLHA